MNSILFSLLAQEQGGQGAPGAAGCQGMMGMLFPILLMFVIIFFLIIRPQQKQQRKLQEMLKALKKGDKIITASGIFGTIVNLNDNVVTLEVAKNVHLRVLRAQVAGLQSGALEKAGEEAAAESK